MIKYQKNNIVFRIASAQAISTFKSDQAASFLQLTRKELSFNDISKESVLLEYDRFFQWIMKIERLCLVSGQSHFTPQLIATVFEYFDEEIFAIENIMDSYPDVFPQTARNFSKLLHGMARNIISAKLNHGEGERLDTFYILIVKLISEYLYFTLLSFHEFNNNVLSDEPLAFLCLSDFGNDSETCFDLEMKRLSFFKECGRKNFTVKNYSSDPSLTSSIIRQITVPDVTFIPEEIS